MRSIATHTIACAAFVASVAFSLAGIAVTASAGTFTDLHSFCSETACADGEYPTAPLVADSVGNFYGTTALGGASSWGTIFELVRKSKGGFKYKVLHSFCAQSNCTDGSDPIAGLVIDTAGNLYGTTKFGGAQNGGTAFELVRRGKPKLNILHSFCAQGAACADGSAPMYDGFTYQGAQTGGPYDGTSPLFGTTIYGGQNNSGYAGTVYELAPNRTGKKWKESVILQFCSQTNCADGSQPHNGLVMDSSGNLYGVTFGGGNASSDGVVFELSPTQSGWTETVLYDFCSASNCTDGAIPESPLAFDAGGDLWGAASSGGTGAAGILFRLAPNGSNWQYTDSYNFCAKSGCADGNGPMGRLAFDIYGNLYGTTITGGDPNYSRGVIFSWTISAVLDVLHTFCAGGNCADGQWPVGGVTLDSSADVFGTASEGGSASEGTVFKQKP